ncbi:MAG: hypothetical protein FWF86_07355 [Clostridia bacterium]|nr:hypothetical protein [Clostridia bacterium]
MPFLDAKSGTLTFDNGVRLFSHMEKAELLEILHTAGGDAPDKGKSGVLAFPACPVPGGMLAVLCMLRDDRLQTISVTVVSVGQKTEPSAEQQRAFLFHCFAVKDPCPDTRRNCDLSCEFGSITLCTDPRVGSAIGRLSYQGR